MQAMSRSGSHSAVPMGYSSDSERPAKRFKPSQPYQRQPAIPNASSSHLAPADHSMMSSAPVLTSWTSQTGQESFPASFPAAHPTFESQRESQPASLDFAPTQLHHARAPFGSPDGWTDPSQPMATASPIAGRDPSVNRVPLSQHSHRRDSQHTPNSAITPFDASTTVSLQSSHHRRQSSNSNVFAAGELKSPFNDCLESFGTFPPLEFQRPNNGFVNGYVKFRWANRSTQRPSISQQANFPEEGEMWYEIPNTGLGPVTAIPSDGLLSPVTSTFSMAVNGLAQGRPDWSSSPAYSILKATTESALTSVAGPQHCGHPTVHDTDNGMLVRPANPRMLPPQFGFQAKMETNTDRKFWEFYIQNWCPGRSVLRRTNLWLNDFGQMHENEGVRAAIQCLAGVYIYDYVPQPAISKRINELFGVAENRLTQLLNDPSGLKADEGRELITIAVILSMQDIVLTERRRKKPDTPRWLEGFHRGEYALRVTDPGSRFWKKNNVQLTSLRVAQSVIVGRAVILAHLMMKLTPPAELDPQKEADRFSWLLYGTEEDMFAIHGGCGFSKKLLHVLSQVTYCAARLRQDPESPIPPMTAGFLITELHEMKQWNSESIEWSQLEHSPQTIEWVKAQPPDFIIDTAEQMTDVTAEAWRVAAIVYTQCRALRLPRDHAEVVTNLSDLANCIRIMPTSGTHFTAQAPLFPVFLLGLTATLPEHKRVSQYWFEQVVRTPVRSSVPPLFKTLQGIWSWIDEAIPLSSQPTPEVVAMREPWWERLVDRVQENEEETPCLT